MTTHEYDAYLDAISAKMDAKMGNNVPEHLDASYLAGYNAAKAYAEANQAEANQAERERGECAECLSDECSVSDEVLLAEQARDFAEMESARELFLQSAGAKEALSELKSYLLHCASDERCKSELLGLKWAVDSIDRRLQELQLQELPL
jgi:hypothetical protein